MDRRMPGVVYPDPAPAPSAPPPQADANDERSMALRFVRTAFDPPLPDPFADWLITLHRTLRDGGRSDTTVPIPPEIRDLGYTFARTTGQGTALSLREALRLFGRHDLLMDEEEALHELSGTVALAAALAAYSIRSTVTTRRSEGGCSLFLRDAQAQELADLLIPAENSDADELGQALELLNHFVHDPRPTPCVYDHGGHCQEHHDTLDDRRSAQHEGHALLVKHGLREGDGS